MSTGILVLIGIGVLFGVLAFFTLKKKKNVVSPTYEETPKPSLSFDPSIKHPEPTPEPQEPELPPAPPTPINEVCYAHEVLSAESVESVCQAHNQMVVYSSNESIEASTQLFMSEEACKYERPNWVSSFTHVKYSNKYSSVDSEGRLTGFLDCIE
jgi:hypothetical protein